MPKRGPKINKAHRSMDAVSLANRLLRFFQKRPGRKFTAADLAFETGMNERTGKSLDFRYEGGIKSFVEYLNVDEHFVHNFDSRQNNDNNRV